MGNLCIIPARGGSKRIPRKNIKLFLGKPIIAYAIEAALESQLFDEVMVSTDDQEIAEIAKKYGAQVPFIRSTENADDHATLSDVLSEVTSNYQKENKLFDLVCCILPTACLTTIDLLKKGHSLMVNDTTIDSVRPIIRFSYPIQRAYKLIGESHLEFANPEYSRTRSQDLEPAFHDAGMFYWMKANDCLLGQNKHGFEIDETVAQDIDNETDWKLAELKYELINKK